VRSERARWGFTNRTDIVTHEGGEREVVQRYRRRDAAERRLRVMEALREPAAAAGIPIPRVRDADLDDDPAWVVFDALPGVPVTEAGLDGPGFPALARRMGEMLAAFRELPADDLELDRTWAEPDRLAASATGWAGAVPYEAQRSALAEIAARVPELFAGRPVVLAHGDYAPVNVLTEGGAITGLLDFEAVRLADPLFDAAWWSWAVSFAPPAALAAGWRPFLEGAGLEDADLERIRTLQVLRMAELLADDPGLSPQIRSVVDDRLRDDLAAR
jgi:aminoglycoside phosphotransferase (APT) family kinase protein